MNLIYLEPKVIHIDTKSPANMTIKPSCPGLIKHLAQQYLRIGLQKHIIINNLVHHKIQPHTLTIKISGSCFLKLLFH